MNRNSDVLYFRVKIGHAIANCRLFHTLWKLLALPRDQEPRSHRLFTKRINSSTTTYLTVRRSPTCTNTFPPPTNTHIRERTHIEGAAQTKG